jgi:hypothetical protein
MISLYVVEKNTTKTRQQILIASYRFIAGQAFSGVG